MAKIPQLLAAARPVVYRHEAPLCQVPWTCKLQGLWLVIDMFSGSGGLLVALATLGIRCIAICIEKDDEAAQAVEIAFPDAIHMVSAEEFDPNMVIPVLVKRKFQGILVAGGAPCQPNSTLHRQSAGLADPQAHLYKLIIKAADGVRQLPQAAGLQVLELFENPVGRPEFQQEHRKDFGGQGILVNAGIFGWVWRRRLFYGRGPAGTFASLNEQQASKTLPAMASLMKVQGSEPTIQWKGNPLPERIRWRGGFKPGFCPADVVAKRGQGAMYTFTTCFKHPDDQPASQAARNLAKEDGNRFPTTAYETKSLLSKSTAAGTIYRTPLAVERAEVHCFPSSVIEKTCSRGRTPEDMEDRRCSLVGNGFHIPSIMLALILLASLQQTVSYRVPVNTPLAELWEARLRNAIRGSAFEPGTCRAFPGIYDAPGIVHELWELFTVLDVDRAAFDSWAATFATEVISGDLAKLQVYWVDTCMRGHQGYEQGPEWAGQKRRAEAKAALSEQRGSSISKKGLHALVTPGMGPEGHMSCARQLPSPFNVDDVVDDDLWFAARCVAVYGPHIRTFRNIQTRAFRRVCNALKGLDVILKKSMHADVARVASSKSPAAMAMMTIIMRWPDRDQPCLFVKGFPMLRDIKPSQIFRDLQASTQKERQAHGKDFLGTAAAEWVEEVEKGQPKWDDVHDIYEQTVKEQSQGYCGPFQSRIELDRLYGIGGWRPQVRFMVTQAGGKRRVIDNARRSGHNKWTTIWQTLFTVRSEFPVIAARALVREVRMRPGGPS